MIGWPELVAVWVILGWVLAVGFAYWRRVRAHRHPGLAGAV
jgi:hypothetical protein